MSGSYLAKVRHVFKYHKISFISVYDIAEVQLIHLPVAHLQGIHIYIYICTLECTGFDHFP